MAATFLSKAAQAVIQTFIRRGEDFWLKLGPNGVALLSRHLAARVLANGVAEDAWPELLAIEGSELASVEKTHRIFSGKAGLLLKAQENGLQIAGVPVAARAVVKATDASSVPYNEITILPDKGTRAFGVGFWELHDALTAIARAARAVRRDVLFALFVEEPGKPVWVVAELGGRRLEFSLGSGLVDIDRPGVVMNCEFYLERFLGTDGSVWWRAVDPLTRREAIAATRERAIELLCILRRGGRFDEKQNSHAAQDDLPSG